MLWVLLASFSLDRVTSGHRVPRLLSQDGVEAEWDGMEAEWDGIEVSKCELCILCFSCPCYPLPRAGP